MDLFDLGFRLSFKVSWDKTDGKFWFSSWFFQNCFFSCVPNQEGVQKLIFGFFNHRWDIPLDQFSFRSHHNKTKFKISWKAQTKTHISRSCTCWTFSDSKRQKERKGESWQKVSACTWTMHHQGILRMSFHCQSGNENMKISRNDCLISTKLCWTKMRTCFLFILWQHLHKFIHIYLNSVSVAFGR